MRTIIKGKNFKVTDDLRQKLEEKLTKITRHKHFVNIKELEIEFMIEKNPSIENNQTVEMTAFTKGPVLRAKEASKDMIASIDLVLAKLDRQFEKYKGKIYRSKDRGAHSEAKALKQNSAAKVVRKKIFSTRPMSINEAILQLELLQHGFYIFKNAETEKINLLYLREDGGLGLMEPE